MKRVRIRYLALFCITVFALSGCISDPEMQRALVGFSWTDNESSEIEAENAQREAQYAQKEAEIRDLDYAIQRYHQVAANVQLGQSKDVVLDVLLPTQNGVGHNGKATEAFMNNNQTIEIFYMRSARISDGKATDDEFTPYSFVDSILVGIGWQVLGGPKTYGDTSAAQNANIAKAQLLLGMWGQQIQRKRSASPTLRPSF